MDFSIEYSNSVLLCMLYILYSKSFEKYKIMQKLLSDPMTPTKILSGGSSPPWP